MRWADEDWIKLYTRDTPDFLALSFEAQALFVLLLRKVDRAGLLPLGKRGRSSIFLAIGQAHRASTLGVALDELVADGCVIVDEERCVMVIRNYAEAQSARASDAVRKRAERARDAAEASKSAKFGENCHAPSHAVTQSHAESHAVTLCHEERRGEERTGEERREEKPAAVAAPLSLEPTPERKKRALRERVLSPISVELTNTIKAATNVAYPPACWDVLEAALAKGDLTPDDARVVVAYASTETFWRATNKLDPSSLFRAKTWPGLLAKGKASKAPTPVPARDGTERRIYSREDALGIE